MRWNCLLAILAALQFAGIATGDEHGAGISLHPPTEVK